MTYLKIVWAALTAYIRGQSWVNKRQELNNSKQMQAAASAKVAEKIKEDSTQQVAGMATKPTEANLDEFRKQVKA